MSLEDLKTEEEKAWRAAVVTSGTVIGKKSDATAAELKAEKDALEKYKEFKQQVETNWEKLGEI